MNLQNNNNQPSPDIIQEKLDIISLANETGVLMSLIMEKLGLQPKTTTHQQFVEAFTKMQKDRLDAEKYMQEQFMLSGSPTKERKKRMSKTDIQDIQDE